MKKFLAIALKETLLLIRDWPGLLILFVMPAILLIIITLTQESAILKEKSGIKVILVNDDSSVLGDTITSDLVRSGSFNITSFTSAEEAEKEVINGKYQLAVIIPDSATEKLNSLLNRSQVKRVAGSSGEIKQDLADVRFIYDPAFQTIYKDAVFSPMKMIIRLSAIKILLAQYAGLVKDAGKEQMAGLADSIKKMDFGSQIPDFPYKKEIVQKFRDELVRKASDIPEMKLPSNPLFIPEIMRINEEAAKEEVSAVRPNPLQNNIPAFTLFAMFFIVIPLAGSIINEKNHGVYDRLRTLPVTYTEIIFGKVVVFLGICILQFISLMLIGEYIIPLLSDLQPLDMNVNWLALFLAFLASGLAATGFGIVVGTFASTHSQAGIFGSVMTVILAMIGGIFLPVYMLPETIRAISNISPLRWGTDAFLGVFTRNEGALGILPQLLLLSGFFLVSLTLSYRMFSRRN